MSRKNRGQSPDYFRVCGLIPSTDLTMNTVLCISTIRTRLASRCSGTIPTC